MGNYDRSVEGFRKALDVQPGSRKTVLALGESLRRAHEPKKAAKVYSKWLESDPGDADLRARLGQVLREAGDLGEILVVQGTYSQDWLLYDTDSPVAAQGRGLARGFLFDRQGRLCVSLAQEGLVRRRARSDR